MPQLSVATIVGVTPALFQGTKIGQRLSIEGPLSTAPLIQLLLRMVAVQALPKEQLLLLLLRSAVDILEKTRLARRRNSNATDHFCIPILSCSTW